MSPVPTIDGKPWYKSKTLWFNGIALMLGMAEMHFKLLEQYIPAAVFPALAFVLAVVNVLLRFITTTALTIPAVVHRASSVDQPAAAPAVPPVPPVPPYQGGWINLLAWLPAIKWLAAAALVAWVVFLIFDFGRDANESKWLKKEAAQAAIDQAEKERLAKLGHIAAQFEIQEQARAAERSAYLLGVMKNARLQFPLVARNSDRDSAVCAGDLAAAPSQAPPAPLGLGLPNPVDTELTLGAVWLWNASLTGEASGAAGACRIDAATGQASAACADSSGLDLDAAFANHAHNAAACKADRARHKRLIDYLNSLTPSLQPSLQN